MNHEEGRLSNDDKTVCCLSCPLPIRPQTFSVPIKELIVDKHMETLRRDNLHTITALFLATSRDNRPLEVWEESM